MKVSPAKTARFSEVVRQCGRPESFTPWVDPKRDPRFQAALRETRVLTLKQPTVGTAKDYGVVGFFRERNASFLIFPRSLRAYEGRRIVGIKYDLIAQPAPRGRVVKPLAPEVAPEPERPPRYAVTVRCTATVELTEEVEADDRREAQESALRQSAGRDVDFAAGKITRRAVKVKQVAPSRPADQRS